MAVNRHKLNANKTELLWACSKYGSVLLLAADGHYGSVRRQSQPAITCASSVSPSHLTSASTNRFQIQVDHAFTGFVRLEEFAVT